MAKILLVDDDVQVLLVLEVILKSENHEVQSARNGMEATKLVDTDHFDVIITDLIMPEKEGLEVIQEIRAGHPDTKLIAMTGGGYGSASTYLSWAKTFGVQQTLTKPFSRDELLSAIATVLKPLPNGGCGLIHD
jgi:DNA-binding NtrC family response regulator